MSYQPVTRWELLRFRSARKGVQAFADAILFWTPGTRNDGIYNRRRVAGSKSWSLHAVGRAFDLGIPNLDTGARVVRNIMRYPQMFGVCEVIFNHQRWTAETGWRHYSGVDPHTGHVHFGFTVAWADNKSSRDGIVQWVVAAYLHP